MNSMVLILVIALLAIAVLGIALGLVFSSRRKAPVVEAPPTVEPVETPEAPVVEPAAPVLEKPESTASRLVRLRQRLAGSQGGLGRGLLALLSRDRLDEDTWESIEDTLITADVGVAPTQELVERLRTRLRQDHHGRQALAHPRRRGPQGRARRCGHLPCRRGRAAGHLGRAGRRRRR